MPQGALTTHARGAALPLCAPRPGPPFPRSPRGLPGPRLRGPSLPYAGAGASGGRAPVFAACPYQCALDFGVRVRVA